MPDVTFFMPLGSGSLWGNNETKYMLRSLEKHFKKDFDVVICADEGVNVEWFNGDLYTEERFYPAWLQEKNGNRNYENYFCTLSKVKNFVFSDRCPEEFIYIYDDVLLNKDVDTVLNIPECGYHNKMEVAYKKLKHGHTILKAFSIVGNKLRFEHHLPLLYERDKLKEMFDKYRFEDMEVPYALATVYFNLYGHDEGTIKSDYKNYKVGFNGVGGRHIASCPQDDIKQIEASVENKTWVNYDDLGLFWAPPIYPLKKWIAQTFKQKSRYEN